DWKPRSLSAREAQSIEALSDTCDSSSKMSHPSLRPCSTAGPKLVTSTTRSGLRAPAAARLTSSNIDHASLCRSSSGSKPARRVFACVRSLTGIRSAFMRRPPRSLLGRASLSVPWCPLSYWSLSLEFRSLRSRPSIQHPLYRVRRYPGNHYRFWQPRSRKPRDPDHEAYQPQDLAALSPQR